MVSSYLTREDVMADATVAVTADAMMRDTRKDMSATATKRDTSATAMRKVMSAAATEKATSAIAIKTKVKTSVVILNWNTTGYLERFVPGILKSLEGMDAELVVADNASTDGSMQMMESNFPDVKRIILDKNYGFTGGYNKALAQLDSEYFVLLNSDIEVPEGWLQPLVETLDNNPEVGACAPKLHSWYERNKFEYAGAAGGYIDCFGFPLCRGRIMQMLETDEGQYDTPADVFWATGACLMIRSSLYNMLGGLDDRFFAHMEEIDLCWRIQLNGYRVRVVPQSVVYHLGGGTLPQSSPWKLKLNYRNNLLLLENNLAKTYGLQLLRSADKDIDLQQIAKQACAMAGRRIFVRKIIDGCTAVAYLLQMKAGYFNAVVQAHREFEKLSRRPVAIEIEAYLSAHANAEVRGIYDKCMIPRVLIHGKEFFGIIRDYFKTKQ